MQDYTLTVELLVTADNFDAAVAEGEALLRDPARGPLVWDVTTPDGETRQIDAEKIL